MVAIQIRDVPDRVRDLLAQEAKRRGQSLQLFLMDVLEHEARMATNRALLAKWREEPVVVLPPGSEPHADSIRRQRDERTQHILDVLERREHGDS